MAKQDSILNINGTIGGMTFYRYKGGQKVRKAGGISKSRFAKDPAFARTRENASEFGAAGAAGKILRDSIRGFMMNAADGTALNRIFKVMYAALKLDTENVRGQRQPSTGLATEAGKAMLRGFNFNLNTELGSILFKPIELDATGKITLTDIVPIVDVSPPQGATHVNFSSAVANVNFATGVSDIVLGGSHSLVLTAAATKVELVPTALPTGNGLKLYLIKVEFMQELNTKLYPLNNGSYSALTIIEVA